MIVDQIKNAGLYAGMGERFAHAFEFLKREDLTALGPGRYAVDGDDVFVIISEYETNPPEKVPWEAHRKYIDIQFVAAGREDMGYAHIASLSVSKPYDEGGDCMLLEGAGSRITCGAGTFAVFMPEDAHRPGMASGNPEKVKKAIAKVRVTK
jgi:biofilm protein TabA